MSGGRFEYLQFRFTEIIDEIEQVIRNNNNPGSEDWAESFRKETIEEFKKGIEYIKKAQIYAQRIDWLLSGDDGEDSFHERLSEDLHKHKFNQ